MPELGEMGKEKITIDVFPKEWSMEKIQQKILEASGNIIYKGKGRRFRRMTKDDIVIEFYIKDGTGSIREIETAYIYLKNS